MSSQLIAGIAGAALAVSGLAIGAGTRSASALPGVAVIAGAASAATVTGGRCQVEVRRNGNPGSNDIRRQELDNGNCVCVITTGPSSANGAAEEVVNALLRDRECTNALAPADLGKVNAATGGGLGGVVMPVVFGVGAIGLGAALGGSSKG